MSVSDSFRSYVVDQLSRVSAGVRARSMFGGVGIYAGDLFFALVDDDVLYLKVDDSNRGDFEARGSKPFQPFGPDGETMQYYALDEGTLENLDELRDWVDKAIAVAAAKRVHKRTSTAKRATKKTARSAKKTVVKPVNRKRRR